MKKIFLNTIELFLSLVLLLFLASIVNDAYSVGLNNPVTVLMYHNICEDESECNSLTITASKMEDDLKWLQDNGYTTILPMDLLAEATLPDKAVIITFDDGYKSNYKYLYPLLKKYKMKANINVIVNNIDDERYANFCNFNEIKVMDRSGLVEIGSHTNNLHNPENGGLLNPDGANGVQKRKDESYQEYQSRVVSDIIFSKAKLEAELGRKVVTFAYPYGAADKYSEKLIKELFPVSFSTKAGHQDLTTNTFFIPRYSINQETDLKKILH